MSNGESISTGLNLDDVRKLFPLRRKAPEDPGARILSTFYIEGKNLDRAECTAAVGREPSNFLDERVRGRMIPGGRPNVLPPSWSLRVVHEPTLELDPCIGELLAMLWPRCAQIKALLSSSSYIASIDTHVIVFEQAPICELTPVTLARLAELGLTWGFSWHDVTPSGEPDDGVKA